MAESPPPALVLGITRGILPPPWFVPVEAPACGEELTVDAAQTNDGVARRLVCDLPAGHPEGEDRHRQVTDNDVGHSLTWPMLGSLQ